MQAADTTCSLIADRSAKVLENENPGPDEIACRSAAVIGVIPTVTIVTFCKVLATAAAAVTSICSLKVVKVYKQLQEKRMGSIPYNSKCCCMSWMKLTLLLPTIFFNRLWEC